MPAPAALGPAVAVNTTTAEYQQVTDLLGGRDGRFGVLWDDSSASGGDTSGSAVRGQVFDPPATPRGGEFLANTTTGTTFGLSQYQGALGALAGGGMVAVWTDGSETGGDVWGTAIRGQIYTAGGLRLGGEFLINSDVIDDQYAPQVAGLANGGFAVVWTDEALAGGDREFSAIALQLFSSTGQRVGGQVQVNTTTIGTQGFAEVAALAGGRFVVSWQDLDSGQSRLQLFAETGAPVGAEIALPGSNGGPLALEALAEGGFGVTWYSFEPSPFPGVDRLHGQRFDAGGLPQGPGFAVAVPAGTPFPAATLWLPDGRLATLIEQNFRPFDPGGARIELSLQIRGADGQPDGAALLLDSNTLGTFGLSHFGQLALLDGHRLVASWTRHDAASGASDIVAQVLDADGTPAATVSGSAGNDALGLAGTAGREVILGLAGDDRLGGSAGEDILRGGPGNDIYTLNSTGDRIEDEAEFSLGGGVDTAYVGFSGYVLARNVEVLRLTGSAALDGTGSAAPDTLVGNGAANRLAGGFGNDLLNGKAGADRLTGGPGSDYLIGEAGNDTFVYLAATDSGVGAGQRDFINGFTHGQDRIDLSAIDANTLTGATNEAFTFIGAAAFAGQGAASAGQVRFFTFGGGNFCIVEADRDGNGAADMQIFVNLTNVMATADFVL